MESLPFSTTSLGDLLQRVALVDDETICTALRCQRRDGGRIGEILVAMGAASYGDVEVALALQKALKDDPKEGMRRLLEVQREVSRRLHARAADALGFPHAPVPP